MSKGKKQLENAIYDAFYGRNPKGDARHELWPDVIKAKKDETLEQLKQILRDVEEGMYD